MPRFRGLGVGPNHVRAGYVGHGGQGRGRAGLSRAAPLAIRGPPDGDDDEQIVNVANFENSQEGQVVLPDPLAPSEDDTFENSQEGHVALPRPIAPNSSDRSENGSASSDDDEEYVPPPGPVENRSNALGLPLSPPESLYSSTSPCYSTTSSSSGPSIRNFDIFGLGGQGDSSPKAGSSDTESAVDE